MSYRDSTRSCRLSSASCAPAILSSPLAPGSIGTLPDQLIAALGGRLMSAVAAPADRRFRRAHVKPARVRRGWFGSRVRPPLRYVLAILVLAYGAYLGSTGVAQARVLKVDRIVVRGNERLSDGEVLAVLSGLSGESLVWTDLDRWRQRLLASPWVRDAALRRSLPSTVEVVVWERQPVGIGRLNDGHVPHRRPRRDHRSVRTSVRGPRPADRRRSVRLCHPGRTGDRRLAGGTGGPRHQRAQG